MRSAASCQTQLLSLNRSTFDRILGSIKKFLKEDYNNTVISTDKVGVDSEIQNKHEKQLEEPEESKEADEHSAFEGVKLALE